MSDFEDESYDVELGPFFTAGILVLAYGLVRRKGLVIAAGLGAIWVDQRTAFGRRLKRRIRSAMKEQIKAHARSSPAAAEGDDEPPRASA